MKRFKILHSSLKTDPNLKNYSTGLYKVYYFPLFATSYFSQVIDQALGASNQSERCLEDVSHALTKAKQARCSHFKIPVDRLPHKLINQVIHLAKESSIKIILQLQTCQLVDSKFVDALLQLPCDCEVEWVMGEKTLQVQDKMKVVSCHFSSYHLSLVIFKNLDWRPILKSQFFQDQKNIHLYFSYSLTEESPFLNCREAHSLLRLCRKKISDKNFLPPKGMDLWDHRVHDQLDLEPFYPIFFEQTSLSAKIRYSVIIPTFNNRDYLAMTLRHLNEQSISRNEYEIIVVDDGGEDQSAEMLCELVKSFSEKINLKYIYFPRVKKRTMGDAQYRAGIARNLGVKHARGEFLCFLDSDILVPPDYLQCVGEALKNWDVVQAKRVNLSAQLSRKGPSYLDINEGQDTFVDDGYWKKFNNRKNWHQMSFNWKYVCTHSLSLRRDVFWQMGGFRRNFTFYGFEDTDMGYRLVRSGYKLHLLDKKVYHLFHKPERSEFNNLKEQRHQLLCQTAQIFYLHHFNEDIYRNLIGYMEPAAIWRRISRRVIRASGLHLLYRKKDEVYSSLY